MEKKGNTRKGSLLSFSFAKLTFLPQRAIVSCISYRVIRVRVTKVVMIHDDLLTQSMHMLGNALAGVQRVFYRYLKGNSQPINTC